jgi:hypothetical protein
MPGIILHLIVRRKVVAELGLCAGSAGLGAGSRASPRRGRILRRRWPLRPRAKRDGHGPFLHTAVAVIWTAVVVGVTYRYWFPSPSLGAPLLSESRSPPLCWGMALCWLRWCCAWTGRCLVTWRALVVAAAVVPANTIATSGPPRTGTVKVRIFEPIMGLSFLLAEPKAVRLLRGPRAAVCRFARLRLYVKGRVSNGILPGSTTNRHRSSLAIHYTR